MIRKYRLTARNYRFSIRRKFIFSSSSSVRFRNKTIRSRVFRARNQRTRSAAVVFFFFLIRIKRYIINERVEWHNNIINNRQRDVFHSQKSIQHNIPRRRMIYVIITDSGKSSKLPLVCALKCVIRTPSP